MFLLFFSSFFFFALRLEVIEQCEKSMRTTGEAHSPCEALACGGGVSRLSQAPRSSPLRPPSAWRGVSFSRFASQRCQRRPRSSCLLWRASELCLVQRLNASRERLRTSIWIEATALMLLDPERQELFSEARSLLASCATPALSA